MSRALCANNFLHSIYTWGFSTLLILATVSEVWNKTCVRSVTSVCVGGYCRSDRDYRTLKPYMLKTTGIPLCASPSSNFAEKSFPYHPDRREEYVGYDNSDEKKNQCFTENQYSPPIWPQENGLESIISCQGSLWKLQDNAGFDSRKIWLKRIGKTCN